MLMMAPAYAVLADTWDDLGDDAAINGTWLTLDDAVQTNVLHTLDASDTNDWFRVVLTAGIPCHFQTIGPYDTKAFLYADSGESEQLYADFDSFDNSDFVYVPTETGTNYLKVQAFPVGFTVSYDLLYSIYAADPWDPYDNAGTNGTLLTMGEVIKEQGPHILNEYDQYDWFRVQLTAGVDYRFESLGDSDIYGELYSDPQGSVMEAEDDDSGTNLNFSIDFTPTTTATYYLRTWTYDTEAQYDLRYHPLGVGVSDADGDGMPDAWEVQYFGSTNELSTGNWDGDAFLNGDEYIAGTDPTDPASFFAITNWSNGSFMIDWPAYSNRQYQVYWTDSLDTPFSTLGPPMLYPQNSYTDTTHSAEAAGFYQVEVQLQ